MTTTQQTPDAPQETRRQYWSQLMDQAAAFMDQAAEASVQECGEPIACLKTAVAEAGVQVQFSETTYATGHQRQYYLRERLIPGFITAAALMNQRGWVMKVEDALRTLDMQTNVGRQPAVFERILKTTLWECGDQKPSADFVLKRYRALVAVNAKVGTHTSASAIDISVYDLKTGQEIDRGAPYLEMSERTPMNSPFVSEEAHTNRQEITRIMSEGGLLAYPFEFWHYNAGDCYQSILLNDGPAKYGPVNTHLPDLHVTPLANPTAPLNTASDMAQLVHTALAHLD